MTDCKNGCEKPVKGEAFDVCWDCWRRAKTREATKRWYIANSEKVKKTVRRWQRANPEKMREAGDGKEITLKNIGNIKVNITTILPQCSEAEKEGD